MAPALVLVARRAAAQFDRFTPGVARTYTTTLSADVLSTAGDAVLTVTDPSANAPGRLVNGAYALAQPLRAAGAPLPATVKSWAAPVSHDPVTIAAVTVDRRERAAADGHLRQDAHLHAGDDAALSTAGQAPDVAGFDGRTSVHDPPDGSVDTVARGPDRARVRRSGARRDADADPPLRPGPHGRLQRRVPEGAVDAPKLNGYVTGMTASLVDRRGQADHDPRRDAPPPVFHHSGPRPELGPCTSRSGEAIYGTGEENEDLRFPAGYGYRVGKGEGGGSPRC